MVNKKKEEANNAGLELAGQLLSYKPATEY
jgi:hypothetical protein